MTNYSDLQANYQAAFGGRMGFGRQPVLLVVDFMNAYTTPGSPLYAPGVVAAVAETRPLLNVARQSKIPVIFTRVVVRGDGLDAGLWRLKVPALAQLTEDSPLSAIVAQLAPESQDLVLVKQFASCFFGTALSGLLTYYGVDTVILTGCSTSGCIRATAIDGIQHGFRVIVPRECVGDRRPEPHEANLFDIDSKYGDVMSKEEVMEYLVKLGAVRRTRRSDG